MEDSLLDMMFEIPGTDGVGEVIVDENVITKKEKPKMVLKKKSKAS
jgi:ATP-dependent protease Clp ATPase subunit